MGTGHARPDYSDTGAGRPIGILCRITGHVARPAPQASISRRSRLRGRCSRTEAGSGRFSPTTLWQHSRAGAFEGRQGFAHKVGNLHS